MKLGVEGCNANSPGFYNGLSSYSETTTLCTDGYYCTTEMINGELKIAQKSCPKGSMGMTSGASSEHLQCDLCEEGFYCDEAVTTTSRITCPKGYICPAGTNGKLQNACPAGFFRSTTGGVSLSNDCTMCPVGSYCNSAAENNTETCDGGYYCWKYTQDKYQTPIYPGKYAAASIGNYTNALDCPQGKYCPIHTSTPVDCPAGTFTSGTGNGEIMNCDDCPAGFYCNTTGSSSGGAACPAAHYCPAGTLDPFSFPCPTGTYNDNTGVTSSSGCTDCPAGSACLERTSTSGTSITINTVTQTVNAIQACAAGHY